MDRGPPGPTLLIAAAFSRHETALGWARERLETLFGPIALSSPVYDFNQTTYYEAAMGPSLRKQLLVFRDLVPPDSLAATKLRCIEIEAELARLALHPDPRPLNVDPGLLTLGKIVLATTKDQSHRIYLRDGIFAEVTLRFQAKAFEPWPWTYADYRQEAVLHFLNEARSYYRRRLNEAES